LKEPAPKRTTVLLESQFQLFKRDFFDWFQKQDWNEIIIKSNIILFLLAFGVLTRLLFAYSYRVQFPLIELDMIWNRVIVVNPNKVPLEGLMDFNYYYVAWAEGWFEDNWYPFPDWQLAENSTNPLYYYSYPPIFLYVLLSLWRPGKNFLWLGLPLIITDAACAGVVFLIIEKVSQKANARLFAVIGGLTMALSPINLIYDGVYWLNPGPVTLFTLVAVYFIVENKWRQGFFWLAIATMTKQNALFFTYPFFMVMLGRKVKSQGIKKAIFESSMVVLYFLLICFLCSLPWLFITPLFYGVHLLFPGRLLTLEPTIVEAKGYLPVQFSFALKALGLRGVLLDGIAIGVNSMFLMILSANILAVPLLWRSFHGKNDPAELFSILSIYIITTHILMPKGVFKFYSAYFTPFLLLAMLLSFNEVGKKLIVTITLGLLTIGAFLGFGVWHLVVNRYFTPLVLFLACIFIGILAIGRRVTFGKAGEKEKRIQ